MMERRNFLETPNLLLRPLIEEDLKGNYQYWLNDPDVCRFNSHAYFPSTESKRKSYFEHSQNSNNLIVLAIINKEKKLHIGNISLQAINWINRNAEIAFLLGEKEFWGKSYMEEAGKTLIEHGFNNLGLHRIYCGTVEDNIGMNRLCEKLNMKKEGKQIDAFFKHGKYFNIVNYAILNPKH